MAGFLGTRAPFLSDLTLILTWIFMLVAGFGAINGRRRRISQHCPFMATAGLLNWIPVLAVMIPKWLEVATEAGVPGTLDRIVPVGHGILGGLTQLLMTYTVTRMYWLNDLPPRRPIWLMRTTIILWTVTVVGGTGVYLTLYVR